MKVDEFTTELPIIIIWDWSGNTAGRVPALQVAGLDLIPSITYSPMCNARTNF